MAFASLFPTSLVEGLPVTPVGDQWIRRAQLVVTPSLGNEGLDLSDAHFQFDITAADVETPNVAIIRVYNLLPSTVKRVQNEYNGVIVSAGYENGAFGTIFKGTLKQIRRGRSSPTDTYMDLLAADYDTAYNFAFANTTLAAGSTVQQRADAIAQALSPYGVSTNGSGAGLTGGILPRGKIMFGMARNYQRDLAITTNQDWSIQRGVLQMVPKTGLKAGQITIMNSQTGMIGMPEQTNQGLMVRCLLNPNLQVGNLLRINNADINQTQIRSQGFPSFTDLTFLADLARDDGDYRIFVVEYRGDTRGNAWYSELTCLMAPGGKVQLYGG